MPVCPFLYGPDNMINFLFIFNARYFQGAFCAFAHLAESYFMFRCVGTQGGQLLSVTSTYCQIYLSVLYRQVFLEIRIGAKRSSSLQAHLLLDSGQVVHSLKILCWGSLPWPQLQTPLWRWGWDIDSARRVIISNTGQQPVRLRLLWPKMGGQHRPLFRSKIICAQNAPVIIFIGIAQHLVICRYSLTSRQCNEADLLWAWRWVVCLASLGSAERWSKVFKAGKYFESNKRNFFCSSQAIDPIISSEWLQKWSSHADAQRRNVVFMLSVYCCIAWPANLSVGQRCFSYVALSQWKLQGVPIVFSTVVCPCLLKNRRVSHMFWSSGTAKWTQNGLGFSPWS